jgi:hypothetical protein
VANAARFIRTTGTYGSSRVPGHPFQDLLDAALLPWGPAGLNGATALFSCVAVFFFYRLARSFRLPHPFVLSLGFAFMPLVYVQSVNALDYMWAMAFLLATADAFFAGRLVLAGVCLGLATGCRITSFAFLLPLVLASESRERGTILLRMGLVATAIAGLCYAPVLWTYGPGYLRYTHTHYPRLAFIVKEATVDVFGLPGLVGLAAVLLTATRGGWSRALRAPADPRWPRLWLLSGLVTVGYAGLFLRLPDDAAYLLPIVPFGLFALASLLTPRRVLVLSACLVASAFIVKVREAVRIGGAPPAQFSVPIPGGLALDLPGPIFADHGRRVSEEAFGDSALARATALPPGSALFVADWYPMLAYKGSDVRIFQYPTLRQVEALRAMPGSIYFLPGVEDEARATTGIDLVAAGGRVLDPRKPR